MLKATLIASVLLIESLSHAAPRRYPWDLAACHRLLASSNAGSGPLLQAAHEQQEAIIQGLMGMMAIPSISSDPQKGRSMNEAADAALAFYKKVVGAPSVHKIQIGSNQPYIIAESTYNPTLPTVIFYAHYDVTPPNGTWTVTEAFTPRLVGDRLYGRGSGDNKGGVYVIGAALQPFLQTPQYLGFNFRVILEGEEEIGSPGFPLLVEKHPELFRDADLVLIPDGANLVSEVPTITTSLRGCMELEVKVTAGKISVHSGRFGNAFPDPRAAVTKATAALLNDDGTIAIPSLYDGLIGPSISESATIARLTDRQAAFRLNSGLLETAQILSRGVFPIDSQVSREISLTVVDIGAPNSNGFSLPPFALAKLAIRVPPGKTPQEVRQGIYEHYRSKTPWNLDVEVSEDDRASQPWIADTEHPAVQLVGASLNRGFQTEPTLYLGSGGTIGLMSILHRATGGAPQMLIGIDDPDTNLHGPDEQLHLRTFAGNRDALIHLLHSLGVARRAP